MVLQTKGIEHDCLSCCVNWKLKMNQRLYVCTNVHIYVYVCMHNVYRNNNNNKPEMIEILDESSTICDSCGIHHQSVVGKIGSFRCNNMRYQIICLHYGCVASSKCTRPELGISFYLSFFRSMRCYFLWCVHRALGMF